MTGGERVAPPRNYDDIFDKLLKNILDKITLLQDTVHISLLDSNGNFSDGVNKSQRTFNTFNQRFFCRYYMYINKYINIFSLVTFHTFSAHLPCLNKAPGGSLIVNKRKIIVC